MKKLTLEDYEANEVRRMLEDCNSDMVSDIFDRYSECGIFKENGGLAESYKYYRDAFYNIVDILNSEDSIGHAVCLVGLRRTGKSVLLSQLYLNSKLFSIRTDEILLISLRVKVNGSYVTRDELDLNKIKNTDRVEFPKLHNIEQLVNEVIKYKKIRCLIIDEITLCEDLILGGKGFVDYFTTNGIKLVFAGTESASFIMGNELSLYTRVILKDISYIPFGEYCRLKELTVDTLENKRIALDKYIEHGNILDDRVSVNSKYMESAVGVNVALTIINSDHSDFLGFDNRIKDLVECIIKYFKLLGDSVTVQNVKKEISRSDISRVIGAGNRSFKKDERFKEIGTLSKISKQKMAVDGAEKLFQKYDLSFGVSEIELSTEQLRVIDEMFTKMGIIYNLSRIPWVKESSGAVIANDIWTMHSLSYNLTKEAVKELYNITIDVSDDTKQFIADSIMSTLKGRLIENIVVIQFIKDIELREELINCAVEYEKGKFLTNRKGTRPWLYKYNNTVTVNDAVHTAEIDLVVSNEDTIDMIEIKKSDQVVPEQARWLHNGTVEEEIRNRMSLTKEIRRYVYYLGEDLTVGDVEYKNLVDVLLKHYDDNFKRI